MKPPQHKLQTQQEQRIEQQATAAARVAVEFNTAEEAIRHDSSHTELPPALVERLKESLAREPIPPARPWWKNIFGG